MTDDKYSVEAVIDRAWVAALNTQEQTAHVEHQGMRAAGREFVRAVLDGLREEFSLGPDEAPWFERRLDAIAKRWGIK